MFLLKKYFGDLNIIVIGCQLFSLFIIFQKVINMDITIIDYFHVY